MTKYRITYWNHIPTLVTAVEAEGGHEVRVALPPRFQAAVDAYAMAAGLADDEHYSAGWRKGPWQARNGSAEAVARAVADELEAEYRTIPMPEERKQEPRGHEATQA